MGEDEEEEEEEEEPADPYGSDGTPDLANFPVLEDVAIRVGKISSMDSGVVKIMGKSCNASPRACVGRCCAAGECGGAPSPHR